jgi:hypothetical protein
MGDVCIFYGHWFYFTAIWHILWPFGRFCGHFGIMISPFWYVVPRKIWQPCEEQKSDGWRQSSTKGSPVPLTKLKQLNVSLIHEGTRSQEAGEGLICTLCL